MKNKTKKRIGIVAAMLGVVVAIGATAGTTLAKYISSATVNSESATVAKWGYTITTNATELFSKEYSDTKIGADKNGNIDVKASQKVVAPGTSSNGLTKTENELVITINGSAEVDAKLVIDITEFETVWLNTAKVKADTESKALGTDIYYPLKWTFTAGSGEDLMKADITLAKSKKAFNEQLAEGITNALAWSLSDEYKGKAVLPENAEVNAKESTGSNIVIDLPVGTKFDNFKFTIAWEWPFEQDKDVEDTVLGWLADGNVEGGTSYNGNDEVTVSKLDKLVDGTDYNLTATFNCTIQIVQVRTQDQKPKF